MRHKKQWSMGPLGVFLCLLAGCALQPSAPTRFYMLSPIQGPDVKLKFAERDRSLAITFLTPTTKPDAAGCRTFRVFAWLPAPAG